MKKLLILLLALSLTTTAFGASRIKIRKFLGLNTRLSDYEIEDNESPDMVNFNLDKAGVLTERGLFAHYNTSSVGSVPITNVYKFYQSSDAGYLLCSADTNIYYATGGALTDILVSDDSVALGSVWDFETFTDGTNEVVYAANNDLPLRSWNGTTTWMSTVPQGPAENVNILKKHKARLFGAGSEEYPYRIYYSSLSHGGDWTNTGGTMDLPSYEKIIALEVLSDVLYVFTRTSIYAILGSTPSEYSIIKTRSNVGTHATKSVVLGNKLIFFLNKAGVFAFDGDQSVNISETIIPTIDLISSTYIGDTACMFDKRGRLWMTYTSQEGSNNDTILVYDTVIKQWYKLEANFTTIFKADGGKDKGELYAGSSINDGWLWQLQTTAAEEQITHSTKTQLETGVTSNTVYLGTESLPKVPIIGIEYEGDESYTGMLLHFEPVGAVNTTKDYSNFNHTISYQGNAENRGFSVYGNHSCYFDGTGDYLTVPTNDIFNLSATDTWTIDFWVYFTDASTDNSLFQRSNNDPSNNGYGCVYNGTNNQIIFTYDNGGADITAHYFAWGAESTTWYHIALVSNSGTVKCYIDGTALSESYDSSTLDDVAFAFWIGLVRSWSGTHWINLWDPMDGYIDEFRLVNGKAQWTSNFTPPGRHATSGTLTSDNLRINASGQSSLGAISWSESLPTDTDIQFTTRTGTTNDTTYDTWTEAWVSTSTVVTEVTDNTVWISVNDTNLPIQHPTSDSTTRDVVYYEWDDQVSPNCVQFEVFGARSKDSYADAYIPIVNVSSHKFIGYWLQSPNTGNSVRLDMGEVSGTSVAHTTATTVATGDWEYHYWPIANYTSSDLDAIKWLRMTYVGDNTGLIRLGVITAYDFLDDDETITSTPNDYIQYRAILGTEDDETTPYLQNQNNHVVQISYAPPTGTSESALSSYWYSKRFDLQNEYTKFWRYLELDAETANPTTGNTIYVDYDLDDGYKTGTLSKTFTVTGRRVKMRFYFPSGTFSRNMQLKLRDEDVDSDLEVHNLIVNYTQESY